MSERSEELVSVVTDYRITWRQPEGRQDAIDLLLRCAGGGGGMGAGSHGAYSASPAGKPRLSQPALTDAERAFLKRERDLMDPDDEGDRKTLEIIDGLLKRHGGRE